MEVVTIVWGYERRWIGWFATPVIHQFWVWVIKNQWLWALFSLSIPWRRETLKQCQSSKDSLTPLSLDTVWIGKMVDVGKKNLVKIDGMFVRKKKEVENCWGTEEERVSGDCKDDFVKKQRWNRVVKIDWSRRTGFCWRLQHWLYAQVGLW